MKTGSFFYDPLEDDVCTYDAACCFRKDVAFDTER